ncbi:PhzF family phenazine biosynthesis protein [Kordiimonas sp.]|uniref:PhzF family phenazine biosynthesis protein n=1 Tax=Kordiimonas sp. TaxID=1970157 RepID=UPI003A9311D4
MKRRAIDLSIIDAFVKNGDGGNPAGVVLDAGNLSEADMQAIALKAGLSETAFVSPHAESGFRLDFFTPNRRIAHCGHATIAVFSHMARLGIVGQGETVKHTVDGPRKIIIQGHRAYMEQIAPRYEKSPLWQGISEEDVLASLGITRNDLIAGGEPILVNTGNSFMLIGVRDAAVLSKLRPNRGAVVAISETLNLVGYYVFTPNTPEKGVAATARMFGPRYSIEEEAATGMAAGPLACLLYDRFGLKEDRMVIEQGRFMATPSISEIEVQLKTTGGQITGLMAGGEARPQSKQQIVVQAPIEQAGL